MRHEIKSVGYYGIGENRVMVTADYTPEGVRLLAVLDVNEYLPESTDEMTRLCDGTETASLDLTWDYVRDYRFGGTDDCIRHAAAGAAGDVVRKALHLKPAGVTYSDGSN